MAAACGGPAAPPPAPAPAPASLAVPPAAARSTVNLVIPPGEGGGPFATPRALTVPPGWTARVWARVPGARMEAWTPGGDLLVSQPPWAASWSSSRARTAPPRRTFCCLG